MKILGISIGDKLTGVLLMLLVGSCEVTISQLKKMMLFS